MSSSASHIGVAPPARRAGGSLAEIRIRPDDLDIYPGFFRAMVLQIVNGRRRKGLPGRADVETGRESGARV